MRKILFVLLSLVLLLGCRTVKKTESLEKNTAVTEVTQKTEQSAEKESLKQDISIKFDSVKLGEITYPVVIERKNKEDTIVYVTIKNVSDIKAEKESSSEKESLILDEVKKDSVSHISSNVSVEKEPIDWFNVVKAWLFIIIVAVIVFKIKDIISFIRKIFS